MLWLLHEGHLWMEKCKRRAQGTMYCLAMNSDIDHLVGRCDICLTYRNAQQKEPLIHHDWPLRRPYLLTVDAHSHYPEVWLLHSESSKAVIGHLKALFVRYGIPDVKSDNGTQFSSAEFQSFLAEWGVSPDTSSPRYPKSNGLAANAVQVVKKMMLKCIDTGEDPFLALLAYRNSPLEHGMSPTELMFGRKMKTRLPSLQFSRQAKVRPSTNVATGKVLPPLQINDTVCLQDIERRIGKWARRAIVTSSAGPRSYNIQTESGQEYRRNRRHPLKTDETFEPTEDDAVALPAYIDSGRNRKLRAE